MKLILLRHAKSSWADENQTDFERPLNKRGQRDAPDMADRLRARGHCPDKILCSPATRTHETSGHFVKGLGVTQPIEWVDSLYEASPGELIAAIGDHGGDAQELMVIGHNPSMEYVASMLNQNERITMATCAVCVFDVAGIESWSDLDVADVTLDHFDYPKNT